MKISISHMLIPLIVCVVLLPVSDAYAADLKRANTSWAVEIRDRGHFVKHYDHYYFCTGGIRNRKYRSCERTVVEHKIAAELRAVSEKQFALANEAFQLRKRVEVLEKELKNHKESAESRITLMQRKILQRMEELHASAGDDE